MINNNSYFCIIVDYQKDMSLTSMKAINSLISSRINSDISMKIACEPIKWLSYYSLNNDLIENIHDYDIIELDNNYSEYVKSLNYKVY